MMRALKNIYSKANRESPWSYLQEAKQVAIRDSNCEVVHWGAVLVNWRGQIIGRGTNYVPNRELFRHCKPCIRKSIRSCTRHEMCVAIHAEVNAIIDAITQVGARKMKHADMFVYGFSEEDGPDVPIVLDLYPCHNCSLYMQRYQIQNLWYLRPTAKTDEEKSRLPTGDGEYSPDYITGKQLWFHPGTWLGIEGHTLSYSQEFVKIAKMSSADRKI